MAAPKPSTDIAGSTREILRRLELDVTRRLDGLLHGEHKGLVAGHGTELGETRKYSPGDDVRRIDWNVTARLSNPYIRQTIAERELQTWLIVDRSARLDFGTTSQEKRELALSAAAAIGFLTSRDGNRLGAVLTGQGSIDIIPAGGSRKHLLRILHQIAETPRQDGTGITDLSTAISRCNSVTKRRGLLAVISDFQVQSGWEDTLAAVAQRHDVLAIQVTDPREFHLPNVGVITIQDPATGQQREIATNKASVRKAFSDNTKNRQQKLENRLRTSRVDHLVLATDRPWLNDLVQFVIARKTHLATQSRKY